MVEEQKQFVVKIDKGTKLFIYSIIEAFKVK